MRYQERTLLKSFDCWSDFQSLIGGGDGGLLIGTVELADGWLECRLNDDDNNNK